MWIRDDKKIKQLNSQQEEVTKPIGPDLQRENIRKTVFWNFWVRLLESLTNNKEQQKFVWIGYSYRVCIVSSNINKETWTT